MVRKQVVKNMGMLRSYSVEEDSGNRSRQMLKEVTLIFGPYHIVVGPSVKFLETRYTLVGLLVDETT